jgi:hypothetical protein
MSDIDSAKRGEAFLYAHPELIFQMIEELKMIAEFNRRLRKIRREKKIKTAASKN